MSHRNAGSLLLIHAGLSILLQLTILALPAFQGWLGSSALMGLVIRMVIMQGALILLPTLFVLFSSRQPAAEVTGGRSTPSSLILAAAIGVPAGIVFWGLNHLILYLVSQLGRIGLVSSTDSDTWSTQLWDQSAKVVIVLIIVRVLAPAVIEELMFRGVIFGSLKHLFSPFWVIFWQAVAFSLFHNDPLFSLPPLLAGLLLGLLRQNGNSILPPMLTHVTMNLTLLAISPLLPRLTADYLNLSSRSFASLFYASLIATFIAAVALIPLIAMLMHLKPAQQEASETRSLAVANIESVPAVLPGVLRFALALLVLLVTMVVTYIQRL